MACSGDETQGRLVDGFDVQGHRGCRGVAPENTQIAFMKALEDGANTL